MSQSSNPKANQPQASPEPEAAAPEAADKVERPHVHFEHAADVVVDPLLSKDEKVRALDVMGQDAKQLAVAAAEGMAGEESDGSADSTDLNAVLTAKDSLDLPPFDLATSVVVQGLKARLPQTSGETHDVIAQAIAAVEAASAAIGSDAPGGEEPKLP